MPLPQDERVVALANHLLEQFDGLFGVHPGYRAAHAKGALFTGAFTPTPGSSVSPARPMWCEVTPR